LTKGSPGGGQRGRQERRFGPIPESGSEVDQPGPAGAESSRDSAAGAGWQCAAGSFQQFLTKRDRPFSWLSPAPLWQSRNDRLARWFGDPTDDHRRAWMEGRAEGDRDLVVDYSERESISFLVIGDTGEGDASQYAVVPPLLTQAAGTAFLFILSDVIYPAGGTDEYGEKFFRPYRGYPGPIYAVPGNHDWYDDLTGFMYWFCGADARPRWKQSGFSPGALLRGLLWRRPPGRNEEEVEEMRAMRAEQSQQATQPAPYLVIDAGPLRLVGIDTGIIGDIDRDQGEWLRRVSASSPKPKILLTGKPIYVDGEHHPGPIEGGGTVDEVVIAPEHNYIAAIGGDIHNYQRYPVTLADGRTLVYVVSGGGGAFMHETHTIPNLDSTGLRGLGEAEFRCYPLRGDSLSRFSQLWSRKWIGWLLGARFIEPDQAAAIVGERLRIPPSRESAREAEITSRARRTASILFRLPARGRRGLHVPFSEWLDWNQPPFFKHFLRVDADPREVRIRCLAASGCREQEGEPPLEDELRAEVGEDGTWRWQEVAPG
jgi:Calcineurin-like phosphoesterase